MLVDGAIVMVEFADTKIAEGYTRADAYVETINRMFWPIMASTLTTLAAFLPMMFWPGIAGEFMRYLPITVFAVLVGSLLYALLFAPVIGALFGSATPVKGRKDTVNYDEVNTSHLTGVNKIYGAVLRGAVRSPGLIFLGSVGTLVSIIYAYLNFGAGFEFFTSVEPNQTRVQVFARGNYSP